MREAFRVVQLLQAVNSQATAESAAEMDTTGFPKALEHHAGMVDRGCKVSCGEGCSRLILHASSHMAQAQPGTTSRALMCAHS